MRCHVFALFEGNDQITSSMKNECWYSDPIEHLANVEPHKQVPESPCRHRCACSALHPPDRLGCGFIAATARQHEIEGARVLLVSPARKRLLLEGSQSVEIKSWIVIISEEASGWRVEDLCT